MTVTSSRFTGVTGSPPVAAPATPLKSSRFAKNGDVAVTADQRRKSRSGEVVAGHGETLTAPSSRHPSRCENAAPWRSTTVVPPAFGVRRDGEQVTPLELFFDLVFVLARTQCTAVMVDRPTWAGVGQAMLVLGVLWWAWVGYAWLTSVLDPEEGVVRLVMFVATAAFLVTALASPTPSDTPGYVRHRVRVRAGRAHRVVPVASREERTSQVGDRVRDSTAVGIGLIIAARDLRPAAPATRCGRSRSPDMAGPYFFGARVGGSSRPTSPSAMA